MMLMSWPTLMNRPRSRRIAASIRRAFLRCLASVSRSIASGRRKRRAIAEHEIGQRDLGGHEVGDEQARAAGHGTADYRTSSRSAVTFAP